MPCSAIFRGCIRTTSTSLLSVSLRRTARTYFTAPKSLKPSQLVFFTRNRPPGIGGSNVRFYSKPRVASSVVESERRVRQRRVSTPFWYKQSASYSRFSFLELLNDELDSGLVVGQQQSGASTFDDIDEWRSKLTMLLNDNDMQEVVSREKKDRRDFQKISALANEMGLHSRQYEKVVVFSKVPLPNYRPDLDDKRPQREVDLPLGLLREVDAHLKAYLSQNNSHVGGSSDNYVSGSSSIESVAADEGLYKHHYPDPLIRNTAAMEAILLGRSSEMRNKQRDWLESPEGQKMLELRRSLPAFNERDALLKAISENQVIVVSGQTGCGKTTQVPQYILESEIEAARGAACSIICTQPRRISATSVSERVAAERGEKVGESVGYKVRLEGMRGKDTCLLFCTTGVLLRRLVGDRDLKGVTHIIVDEIHERGMNEDFLLVVLKDLLPRRPELRLVLMSATLNAELFSSYFGGAPTLHIPGFTHPVHAHFLENVLEMTGYLLSPDNQIDDYGQEKGWKMQKQVQALKKRKSQIASSVEGALKDADFQKYSMGTQLSLSIWNPDSIGFNLIERVLCHIVKKERPGAVLVFLTGWDDINSLKDKLQAHPLLGNPRKVLLLACHGSMDSSEQRLIFDRPEDGVRKIVLATNMAETSITINDVVFVVDCGKAKETSYDALNNTPCLLPAWISKAAAQQRRGRAGRVQPGECYHLYPKCVYDAFAEYQVPELLRTPLQSLCLQIKSLQLGSISEFLSRALEPPEPLSVQNAVEYLKIIGALDENENLTTLGRKLAILPVEPKLGKMLILGAIFNCLNPIMTIVAGLSVRDPFYVPLERKSLAEAAKAKFAARDYSDHLALVRAYEGWKDAERRQCGYDYCYKNFLSLQALKAIDSVRNQFLSLLKDIGLVGYKSEGGNRYKRDELGSEECNRWSDDEHLVRAIICAGLYPGVCSVVNKEKSVALKTMDDGQVLLHANSVNAGVKIPYPWLVFNEKVKVNSVQLRDSTAVSDSVLLLFGGSISRGGLDGHLNMLGGYFEFSMKPALAEMYLSLKRGLEELIQKKVLDPKLDLRSVKDLLLALKLLISEDQCHGRFVFNNQVPAPSKNREESQPGNFLNGGGGDNPKNELQKLLARKGHEPPTYETSQVEDNQFRSTVIFNGLNIEGRPRNTKKLADMDAAAEALLRLKGKSDSTSLKMSQKKDVGERHSTSTNVDYMSMLREMGQKKDQGESHSTSTSTSTNVDYMSLLREMREKKTLFGGGKRR